MTAPERKLKNRSLSAPDGVRKLPSAIRSLMSPAPIRRHLKNG